MALLGLHSDSLIIRFHKISLVKSETRQRHNQKMQYDKLAASYSAKVLINGQMCDEFSE